MKRLISCNVDGIINDTVLKFFEIELSERRDIANIDERTAYAIRQAMIHSLQMRYPKTEEKQVNQFAACVIRYMDVRTFSHRLKEPAKIYSKTCGFSCLPFN